MSGRFLPKRHPALRRRRCSPPRRAAGPGNVNYAWHYIQAMLAVPSRQNESCFSHVARMSAARSLDASRFAAANNVRFRGKHNLKSLRWLLHCSGNCIADVIKILQNIQQSTEDGKLKSIIESGESNIRAVQEDAGDCGNNSKTNVYEVLDKVGQCIAKIIHTPGKNSLSLPELDAAVCGAFGFSDPLFCCEERPLMLEGLEKGNGLEVNSRVSSGKRRQESNRPTRSKSRVSLRNSWSGKHWTTKRVIGDSGEVHEKNKSRPQSLKEESRVMSGNKSRSRQTINVASEGVNGTSLLNDYNKFVAGKEHVTLEGRKRGHNMPLVDVSVSKKFKIGNECTLDGSKSEIKSLVQQTEIQHLSDNSQPNNNIGQIVDLVEINEENVSNDFETKPSSILPSGHLRSSLAARKLSKIPLIKNNVIGSTSQKPARRYSEPNKTLFSKSAVQMAFESMGSNAKSNSITSRITKQNKIPSGSTMRAAKNYKSVSESPIVQRMKSPIAATVIKKRVSSSRNYSEPKKNVGNACPLSYPFARKSMSCLSNKKCSITREASMNGKLLSRVLPETTETNINNGGNKDSNVEHSMKRELNSEQKRTIAKRTKSSYTSVCTRTFSAHSINENHYQMPITPNTTNRSNCDSSEERSIRNSSLPTDARSALCRPTLTSDELLYRSTSEFSFFSGASENSGKAMEEHTFEDSAFLSETTLLQDRTQPKRMRSSASLWHAAAKRTPKSSRRKSILGALRELVESVVRPGCGDGTRDVSGGGGGGGGGGAAGSAAPAPPPPYMPPHTRPPRPCSGRATRSVAPRGGRDEFPSRLRPTLEDWDPDENVHRALYNSYALAMVSDPSDMYAFDQGKEDQHHSPPVTAAMEMFGRCLLGIRLNTIGEIRDKSPPGNKVSELLAEEAANGKDDGKREDEWEMSERCPESRESFKKETENSERGARGYFSQKSCDQIQTELNNLQRVKYSPNEDQHFKDGYEMPRNVMVADCSASIQCDEDPQKHYSLYDDYARSVGFACKSNEQDYQHHYQHNKCSKQHMCQHVMYRRQLWEHYEVGQTVEISQGCCSNVNTLSQDNLGCKGRCILQGSHESTLRRGPSPNSICHPQTHAIVSNVCVDKATSTHMGSSAFLIDSCISSQSAINCCVNGTNGTDEKKKDVSGLVSKEMYGIGRRSIATCTEVNPETDIWNIASRNSKLMLCCSTTHAESEFPWQNVLQDESTLHYEHKKHSLSRILRGVGSVERSMEDIAGMESTPASLCQEESPSLPSSTPSDDGPKPPSSPCPFGAGCLCKSSGVGGSSPRPHPWNAPMLNSRKNVIVRCPNSTWKCPLSQLANKRPLKQFGGLNQEGNGNAHNRGCSIEIKCAKNHVESKPVGSPFIFHGSKLYTNTALRRKNGLQDECKFFGEEWPLLQL